MWVAVRDWLKGGGAIPDDKVLYHDLIGPEIVARKNNDGKIQLESKKDMKRRGLPSPGRGDALALTFAAPVAGKRRYTAFGGLIGDDSKVSAEYDPNAVHVAAM